MLAPPAVKSDAEKDMPQSRTIMYGNVNVTLRLVKALLRLSSQPKERISLFAVADDMHMDGARTVIHILVRKLIELGMSLCLDGRTDTLSISQ